jgi:hypothetical protein
MASVLFLAHQTLLVEAEMSIIYTEHAKARLKDRGISAVEVEETILQPYFTVPSRQGRFIAVKKYGDKYLKVISEKSNDKITVVTVYWTRRP